jgi:hypothetical protein
MMPSIISEYPPKYYDLVITDSLNAKVNGFELYRRIKEMSL